MLVLLGLSHRSAPVAFRERMAFEDSVLPDSLGKLRARDGVAEALILSTCNRVEILVWASDRMDGKGALREFLIRERHIAPEELDRYTYQFEDLDAVRHLFHVASGLDSMILGEPQILGQVKAAYAVAKQHGATGPVLDRLLQQTLACAKRVRTETGISRNAVSVSFAAVTLARTIFGDLTDRSALLLGAGKMTELTARHLVGNGIGKVTVTNRTFTRAVEVAREFGGEALYWEEAFDHLDRIDIVITGTAAPEPVLLKHHVHDAMRRRRHGPLFVVDIAVPRDVEPDVGKIDNVYLYDIDDLQGVVDSSLEERRRAAAEAREMLEIEVAGFGAWRQTLTIAPTIAEMNERLHGVRHAEIERFRKRLASLTPEQLAVVDDLTRSVVQKILHPAIRTLKESLPKGRADERASLYRQIFDLDRAVPRASRPDAADAAESVEPTRADEEARGPTRILRGGRD